MHGSASSACATRSQSARALHDRLLLAVQMLSPQSFPPSGAHATSPPHERKREKVTEIERRSLTSSPSLPRPTILCSSRTHSFTDSLHNSPSATQTPAQCPPGWGLRLSSQHAAAHAVQCVQMTYQSDSATCRRKPALAGMTPLDGPGCLTPRTPSRYSGQKKNE